MQEGSIVHMTKDMKPIDREAYKYAAGVEPPKPGTTNHMITRVESDPTALRLFEHALEKKVEIAIYLDTYPKYEAMELPFDGDWFSEILPGGNNILEEIEKVKEPVLIEC